LAYLRRHHYRLLSLTDVLTLLENGDGASWAPAVAFTVDDGYRDFPRIAAPIFAEFDCPVTMFVPTGFVDGQLWLWWDRVTYLFRETRACSAQLRAGSGEYQYRWSTPVEQERALQHLLDRLEAVDAPVREAAIADLSEQLDVELPVTPPPAFAPMTWDDVRRTAKHGVTFGPHTVTHRILPLATAEECDWEMRESYRRLREQTDAAVSVFCYPAGKVGKRELDAARRAGFRAAVTTLPAYAAPHGVPAWGPLMRFGLPRFPYPDDRPHLVNFVSGLAQLRRRIRRPRPLRP
jgi:peptidoglycan/xylan/chitin deacetylase (PgdA/CDA1 family)